MYEFVNSNLFAQSEVFELAGKILWEIGGESEVKHTIFTYMERGLYRYADMLEQALKKGCLSSGHSLSRIQDIKNYEQQEEKFEKKYREITDFVKKGDYRNAALSFMPLWDNPEYIACINRKKWLELHDKVSRKCYPIEKLRSWTYQIINDISPDDKVSFSRDSKLLLVGEKLFYAETGELLSDNSGGEQRLCSKISPDGRFYLRVCEDGFEQVDAVTGQVYQHFQHIGKINDLIISLDGRFAVSAGDFVFVNFWDLKDGTSKKYFIPGGKILRVLISYDNQKLILQNDQMVFLFDRKTVSPTPLFKIDTSSCTGLAVNTQFTKILMNLVRPNNSVLEKAGVMILDIKSKSSRIYQGSDSNGFPLLMTQSPHSAEFSNNEIDLLYTIENTVWTYSYEVDKVLGLSSAKGSVDHSALSGNGSYMAITSEGKLYLERIVNSFVYADMDHVPDRDSFNRLVDLRVSFIEALYPDASRWEIESQTRQGMEIFCTDLKKRAYAKERLIPYAHVIVSANSGKSREELLPDFVEELENRGIGYVSPGYAKNILYSVR